ncbi:MAG: hypothetical protein J0M00_25745 [Burkholderiales bacterium]|jgi:hypothetical protein|nr:hypothetical protein [Burkholderiales bacterium]
MNLRLLAPLLLVLAGCASYQPDKLRAGMSQAEVTQTLGLKPTGRYPGPDGQTRLEFATGPYGRITWMVDLDAQGRAVGWAQVMSESSFRNVQAQAAGKDQQWLQYTLGRPADIITLGWLGGSVWSYRYPTNDCLWFQVTLNKDGTLRDGGGYGIDPRCDPPSNWR